MSLIKITEILNTEQENPDVVGEALRNYCFINDDTKPFPRGYKQIGCYETFDVRPDAEKLSKSEIWDCFSSYSGWRELPDSFKMEGYSFSVGNKRIKAVWGWDGDGCLIFVGPDFVIVNDDCKGTKGWYYVPIEWQS